MNYNTKKSKTKILAISSGGGHWTQLLRLRPVWDDCEIIYSTTHQTDISDVPNCQFYVIHDCNRHTPMAIIRCFMQILILMLRIRPELIITTGAAPGLISCLVGKILGVKIIWLDSIANADEVSWSGKIAGYTADLWLTQWPHLASTNGPTYAGKIF